MNRLLALVAVAALGTTGCVVEERCDVRISWDSFQPADGSQPIASCFGAGVDAIDVWVDGGRAPRASVDCDRGFVDLAVSPGYHFYSVEGIQDGRIAYRHAFDPEDSCGLVEFVTTPAAGRLDLQYLFYQDGQPLPAEEQVCTWDDSLLFLSVYDSIANDFAVPGDAAYECGGPFVLELPAGGYTLDWMEETSAAPDYTVAAADCTDRDFDIEPGARTPVPVNLDVDTTTSCPDTAFLRAEEGRAAVPRKPIAGAAPLRKALAQ
jgi:hypothetical protein